MRNAQTTRCLCLALLFTGLCFSIPLRAQLPLLTQQSEESVVVTLHGAERSCSHRLGQRVDGSGTQRQLSWLRCGDPAGRPVIYAHGNPGSRWELFYFDYKAKQLGLQIWVLERPGIGDSDYLEGYGLLDYAADALAMADLEGLERFHVMGWSSGGPPSLALAKEAPERVESALILSSYTNFGEFPNAVETMRESGLPGPNLAQNRPHVFHGVARVVGWLGRHTPKLYTHLAKAEVPEVDAAILSEPSRRDLFALNQEAAFAQGADGVIQDLETQWEAWPFALADIEVPVTVFQGRYDSFVPPVFAESLVSGLPKASLQWLEREGHLYPLLPARQTRFLDRLTEPRSPSLE